MKTLWLMLAGLLVMAPCAAQAPPQTAAQSAAPTNTKIETCTVSGMVVKLEGSVPLKSAIVVLENTGKGGQNLGTVTDAGGRFQFRKVQPGRYRLRIVRNGFATQQYGQRTPNDPGAALTLRPGQTVEDLLFRMIPSAVIAGRILNEDGEPLPWAHVTALREVYTGGKRGLQSEADATTNDLGEYRLFNLVPGRYFLRAIHASEKNNFNYKQLKVSEEDKQSEGYPPTFYPGTADPVKASAVTLKSGEEIRSMDFLLKPVTVYKIRGKVFNQITGRPGEQTMLELLPRNNRQTWDFTSYRTLVERQEGKFEVSGVLPGSYVLSAVFFEEGTAYQANQPVDVGAADIEGIVLTITRGVNVSGHVYWEGKASLEGDALYVFAESQEGSLRFGGGGGKVQPDGSFVFKELPEGSYRVHASGKSRDAFLKAARYGTSDALESGFTVRHGTDATLEVILSSRGARVEGTVLNVDSLPVAGVWVALVPEEAHRDQEMLFQEITTDQYGHFVLSGIAPGEYKLFSWDEIERGAWRDPEFLTPFEAKGEKIRVEEGEKKSIELRLIETKQPAQQNS